MRKTISTGAVLAMFSPVMLVAACISGGKVEESSQVEDTVASQLPLSPACGDCAEQAFVTSCQAELQACANTQNCLDVSGCMDACSPNDVACFAQCAQASAPFVELVDCVLCDSCAQECANDWSCGGNQPPQPPPDEDCAQCILDDSSTDCQDLAQQCESSTDCVAAVQCLANCGLTDQCAVQCGVQGNDDLSTLLTGLYQCAQQSPCAQVCDLGNTDPPPPPPQTDCQACAQTAIQNGACHDLTEQCTQTPGCQDALGCASQCGADAACIDMCLQGSNDAGAAAAQQLIDCAACDACADVCGQDLCM